MTQPAMTQPAQLPLYSQVRERLRELIVGGALAPRGQLPSESELGAAFKVSRITVRQALADLQRENLIFKIPGKGAFVSEPKAFQQLSQLEGFAEALGRMGHEVRNRVLSHRTGPAPAQAREKLGLGADEPATEIRRVRLVNREPISYEVTWLPAAVGERLRREDLAGRDIFLLLENEFAIPLGHADLAVDAMLADEQLAAALNLAKGAALLRIERLTHTAEGRPLDYEHLYFRGDAFQYRLRLARVERDAHG